MSHYKPDPNKNVNLTIDSIPVCVPEGTKILEAARKAGINIPTLCEHPNLCKRAVCRICVVECDGRGKLIAACANDVWEGVNIVTNNLRLLTIRKTIVEMLLAEHPQECLSCIRNTQCELQKLSEYLLIREPTFLHDDTSRKQPVTENNVLVRDAGKCIKCGRCIEACQEVQTIRAINSSHRGIHYTISTPYNQALADGPCVFCGQCSYVCPVGAIYEHEQTDEVWAALREKENSTVIQINPNSSIIINKILGLLPDTVNPEKMVTALKRLGFEKVYNSQDITAEIDKEENNEFKARTEKGKNLPMITGCSEGVSKFVNNNYPDLKNLLYDNNRHHQKLNEIINSLNSGTTVVSAAMCLAQKLNGTDPGTVLTTRELVRMFTLAGIDFNGLPGSSFDSLVCETATPRSPFPVPCSLLEVRGFAEARKVLDSVRTGTCDASWIKIYSCPQKENPYCVFNKK